MIFVILGTHELPFERLLTEVEKLKASGVIEEDIVVQNGHTPYESEHMTFRPFVSYEDMDRMFDDSDLIITHAGTGSVTTALKKGKRVIAVARLKEYGEHNDDHQLELVRVFEEQGYILSWDDTKELEDVIHQSEDFTPAPFKSGKAQLIGLLQNYIDDL
ncbi:PssE/Cps14G family polysaccharide biosynthesis glycosyltransferase [Salimicrobium sp. PL1-032A]|uniref:PssE/Cps14G family polysaccharide biosynthesis glycosyltransferase n=1 Tax=Salimicrobium sp. PL1-032A TaxID=3095364 RepID=UPI00326075E6